MVHICSLHRYLVLSVLHLCFQSSSAQFENAESISNLLRNLLKGYDKDIVPVHKGKPVHVTVQMFINDMVPFEKIYMHYSADFFLHLRWFDYRLRNKTYVNSSIPLSSDSMSHLWLPDLFFPRVKKGSIHDVPEVNAGARLYLNGTIVYSKRMSVVSFCPMELLYYPFDIQECSFPLMSYSYSNDFMELSWNADSGVLHFGDGDDFHMSDFNHVQYKTRRVNSTFGKLGNHDRLIIDFKFFRFFPFYFLRDFFPCVLIVVLSWVSFWIDYTSTPARVALGITTILTIVTMTNNVRASSPPAGMFRSLDYYLLMCNLFVFAALGEFALVGLTDYRRRKPVNEMKEADSGIIPLTKIGANNGASPKESTELYPENRNLSINSRPPRTPGVKLRQVKALHRIDNISKVLFPLAFCIFNAIYFLFHRFSKHTVD